SPFFVPLCPAARPRPYPRRSYRTSPENIGRYRTPSKGEMAWLRAFFAGLTDVAGRYRAPNPPEAPLPLRPDRDGQSQPEDEDAQGENDEQETRRERLERPQPARRDRAHADQQQNRDHEPEPFDAEPEDHQACGDENDRSQCRDVARRQRPRI